MAEGAFKQTSMRGSEFVDWLDKADSFHHVLMREAKLKVNPRELAPPVSPGAVKK
jgi:hypothetical protein